RPVGIQDGDKPLERFPAARRCRLTSRLPRRDRENHSQFGNAKYSKSFALLSAALAPTQDTWGQPADRDATLATTKLSKSVGRSPGCAWASVTRENWSRHSSFVCACSNPLPG